MSDYGNENICPKCGMLSANPDVCDNCGALLAKLRDRRPAEMPPQEVDQRAAYAPGAFYAEPSPRPWFTIIAGAVLVVAIIAAAIIIPKQKALYNEPETVAKRISAKVTPEPEATPPAASAGETTDSAATLSGPPQSTDTPSAGSTPAAITPTTTPPAVDNNKLLGWLNSVKNAPVAAQTATRTPEVPVLPPEAQVAATPAVTPAPPSPTPARSPTPQTAKAGKKTDSIDLGEDMFTKSDRPSIQSERVAQVLDKLQQASATPAAQPAAAPQGIPLNITAVDERNFASEVMTYTQSPVLLGFFSPSVPESNSIAQPLLTLSQQQAPKVKVGIVNVDEAKGLKQRYAIQSLPTTVLIRNGQEYTRFQGELSVPMVNQALEMSAVKNLPH